ncbi:MAG: NTP transferase domain-containing protein [Ardenticatenaceae bacterium]|nr:NTP transferase domain-containing protein [Ardenticatenaceae bacterium]
MKVIIPLAGFGSRMRPHTWSRAKPLLNVAGNTVIGHLLDQMAAVTTEEVVFVVGYKGAEIEAWIREHYPYLNSHFVQQTEPLGQAHALWLCRDFMVGEVLVAFGDGIVKADYTELPEAGADVVMLVEEVADPRLFGVVVVDEQRQVQRLIEKPDTQEHRLAVAGVHWFQNGRLLAQALDTVIREERKTKGEYYLADAYQVLLAQGAKIVTKSTTFWLDAGSPENILATNTRLLGLGYGSAEAIERSYAEDFTVIPPVFLHETAVIERAVIGPYTSIEAGAVIRDSIVRHSLIDAEAHIENCILDTSLIGERAQVQGQSLKLFVGDDGAVELT